jgi:hypothetical protein
MSQQKGEAIYEGIEDIRSIEGSEWTLETISIGTISDEDENTLENGSNSTNALLEVPNQFLA